MRTKRNMKNNLIKNNSKGWCFVAVAICCMLVCTSGMAAVSELSRSQKLIMISPLKDNSDSSNSRSSPDELLLPSSAEYGSDFGYAVALSSNIAVIGAPNEDAAYVFYFNGDNWEQTDRLTRPTSNTNFGQSVAIDGNIIVIGAPLAQNEGRVFVYQYNEPSSSFITELLPDSGFTGSRFGNSVAISNNTIVGGAPYAFSDQGAVIVYVEEEDVWTKVQTLEGSDSDIDDHFGDSVAVEENTIVIGAPDADPVGSDEVGIAYIFCEIENNYWIEEQEFEYEGWNGGFGDAVDIDSNRIAVGAPPEEVVYIYEHNGSSWNRSYVINSPWTYHGPSLFGSSLCLSGNYLVIGAPYGDVPHPILDYIEEDRGCAGVYRYLGTGWFTEDCLSIYRGDIYDMLEGSHFGMGVAIDGDIVLCGAPDYPYPYFFTGIVCGYYETMYYLLDTSVEGEGMITVDPDQSSYPEGTIVHLIAEPTEDFWCFSHWSGDLDSTNPDVYITMDSDKSVTAHFYDGCPWDVYGSDGMVTPQDAGLIKFYYGSTDPDDLAIYDINDDGSIDPQDVGLVKYYYGPCPECS